MIPFEEQIVFNEIEPYAAAWLRNLCAAGVIANGRVEEKSVSDLAIDDVRGLTQFHTFAGIGVWSHALRLAGWPDDLSVWTGSCPCQPFSVAGKGGGVEDERHLWPDWFRLIEQCLPPAIFGEQVASKAGLAWLDSVRADLEGAGYAFGASDLAAAGVGAPHIRQRLYFCAFRMADAYRFAGGQGSQDERGSDPRGDEESRAGLGSSSSAGGLANNNNDRCEVLGAVGLPSDRNSPHGPDVDGCSEIDGMGDASSEGSGWNSGAVLGAEGSVERGVRSLPYVLGPPGAVGGLGNNNNNKGPQGHGGNGDGGGQPRRVRAHEVGSIGAAGATRGFWADADWLPCRDGKWRPVEPGTFPLAHGATSRVGRLRAYGNAINAELAAEFIQASVEAFEGILYAAPTRSPGA